MNTTIYIKFNHIHYLTLSECRYHNFSLSPLFNSPFLAPPPAGEPVVAVYNSKPGQGYHVVFANGPQVRGVSRIINININFYFDIIL